MGWIESFISHPEGLKILGVILSSAGGGSDRCIWIQVFQVHLLSTNIPSRSKELATLEVIRCLRILLNTEVRTCEAIIDFS